MHDVIDPHLRYSARRSQTLNLSERSGENVLERSQEREEEKIYLHMYEEKN
jgi:hypothetical protein